MTHAHAIFAMFGWPNLSNIKKFDKFPVGIFQRYTITIPYPSPLILIVKEGGGGRVEPKSDTTCQRNEPE